MRKIFAILLLVTATLTVRGAEPEQLYYSLRNKVLTVKDYTADVRMRLDISYMKIPKLLGKLYFKAPDKLRMERQGGISILPKKNMSLTLNNLIPDGKVTVIDAGTADVRGKKTRILKIIPEDDRAGIVLAKIWVDETAVLAMRTETTTLNEGTVTMDLEYGKYASYALPDKVTITMDVKNYKLPKGVTMDYGDAPAQDLNKTKDGKSKRGAIEINYLSYTVNKGLDDAIFRKTE